MVSLLWRVTAVLVFLWAIGLAINIGAWVNFLMLVGHAGETLLP